MNLFGEGRERERTISTVTAVCINIHITLNYIENNHKSFFSSTPKSAEHRIPTMTAKQLESLFSNTLNVDKMLQTKLQLVFTCHKSREMHCFFHKVCFCWILHHPIIWKREFARMRWKQLDFYCHIKIIDLFSAGRLNLFKSLLKSMANIYED